MKNFTGSGRHYWKNLLFIHKLLNQLGFKNRLINLFCQEKRTRLTNQFQNELFKN